MREVWCQRWSTGEEAVDNVSTESPLAKKVPDLESNGRIADLAVSVWPPQAWHVSSSCLVELL
jgi:hypothetical protein